MRDLNLCPGYMPGKTGYGMCACGLHWQGTMPPHTPTGEDLTRLVERRDRQGADAYEASERRARERAEARAAKFARYLFRQAPEER